MSASVLSKSIFQCQNRIFLVIAQFKLMTALDKQKARAIESNFNLVVDFLDRRLSKTNVQLSKTPCYFYNGSDSKLEIIVFSNPGIATIDIRLMRLKSDDKEPYFESSYDLDGLSMNTFKKAIDDLVFQIK